MIDDTASLVGQRHDCAHALHIRAQTTEQGEGGGFDMSECCVDGRIERCVLSADLWSRLRPCAFEAGFGQSATIFDDANLTAFSRHNQIVAMQHTEGAGNAIVVKRIAVGRCRDALLGIRHS